MSKLTFSAAPWLLLSLLGLATSPAPLVAATYCNAGNTVHARVAAIDQAWVWNRYGALQPHGMMFALTRDLWVIDSDGNTRPPVNGEKLSAGHVLLRPDKRPRPLVLRVNRGQCLQVEFTNYLDPSGPRNQFQRPRPEHAFCPPDRIPGEGGCGDQPGERWAGFHPNGLELADDIGDDGSHVGANPSSLVGPNKSTTYTFLAGHEGTFFVYSPAATTGGDGNGGSIFAGLFAAVNVEPEGSVWYRSQIRQDELAAASTGTWPTGHPKIDYNKLRILGPGNEILHSDLTAVIDTRTATFEERNRACYLADTKDRDPGVCADPRTPFREFTILFHDESGAIQAFDEFEATALAECGDDDHSETCRVARATEKILHSVRDGFAINYGTAGAGAEVLANRKELGPVRDCPECLLEEFFLSSWAVGDPAMVVDLPANMQQDGQGRRPTGTYYPDDPSNVYHSYLNDRLVFRNLHAGPKEHHVFHLHAHQWLQTQYNPLSSYLDSQTIGPGGTYTYEIAYGGSGNRNRTVGDSIFHCHFYPHFAQGMWGLWRVHDVFEAGTVLRPKEWKNHLAVPAAGARALPDGEILAGSPIPAVVPLPGIALAPVPGPVAIVDGQVERNVEDPYPGYPFFVPGKAGHRAPSPPHDTVADGGLPRHIVEEGKASFKPMIDGNDFSLDKDLEWLTPRVLPEVGTPGEIKAMEFHALENHPSIDDQGSPALFATNGLAPAKGAPYANPCPKDAPLRKFEAAVFQLDLVFNKKGWHTPQARMLALREDVFATLKGKRAPQPFFFRVRSGDCIEFQHSNIVPRVYAQDAFQIRTPTDIIGQHIHLVKFDVTSSDGGANGFNYEDGTTSPEEVRERIEAIRNAPGLPACRPWRKGEHCLHAKPHPWYPGKEFLGGRVTTQRWYADPQLFEANGKTIDKTLETVFTHDHFGASTHQQAGLYAGLIVEPKGAKITTEDGQEMGSRGDGGPTDWKALVEYPMSDGTSRKLREFGILYQDFHIAYKKGPKTSGAINAPGQVAVDEPKPNLLVQWEDRCTTFPHCPEAVSADDIGAASINYRSEPAPLRLLAADGKSLASGDRGDLAFLFQSIERADPDLNRAPANYPLVITQKPPKTWPLISKGMQTYDPFTPIIEVFDRERFKIRMLAGAHEHEHSFTLNAATWRAMPYEPDSGFRSFTTSALSEHHEILGALDIPAAFDTETSQKPFFDHLYKIGASVDDVWYGNWGLVRAYRCNTQLNHLTPLDPDCLQMQPTALAAAELAARADTGASESKNLIDDFKDLVRDRYVQGSASTPELETARFLLESSTDDGAWERGRARVRAMSTMLEESVGTEADFRTLSRDPASRGPLERALLEEAEDFEETVSLVGASLGMAELGWKTEGRMLREAPPKEELYLAMAEMPDKKPAMSKARELLQGDEKAMMEANQLLEDGRRWLPKVIEVGDEANRDMSGLAVCPPDAPLRAFGVSAVAAEAVLKDEALVYHRFPKSPGPGERWQSVEDPSALLYVRNRYLKNGKLDPAYKVEPLILRARSGDCIEIHLSNRLPADPTELAGYNSLPNLVQGFNFNQLSVSNEVGLHVQGLRYHVGNADGQNVGFNLRQTVPPGKTKVYRFYAGRWVKTDSDQLDFQPIEFGVVNLMPADPIVQNSKGLIGALVIEPPNTVWAHDLVPPEPYTDVQTSLVSRAAATVFSLTGSFPFRSFRDLVLVGQDDANFNLRFSRGGKRSYLRPVRRVAQATHCEDPGCWEAPVKDEEVDSVDSGHKAFNYRSEALWMRRSLSAALPLASTLALPAANVLSDGFVGAPNQTPRFCLEPGEETRLRLAFPGGHGRNHVIHVHGHNFFEWPFKDDSTVLGENAWSAIKGSQDGVGPGSYFNLLFASGAGGDNAVEGDYLIRDQYSWGFDGGLWAVLDVAKGCPRE